MKQKLFGVAISFLLLSVVLTSTAWARQVVTDDVKLWAREAIEHEKALQAISAPANTVAILYFLNKTDWPELNLLQKGLTIMLMTDLFKVKELQVVERVKLQALVNELNLGVSGLVEGDTASRLGKLLGTEHLIGGDIIKNKIGRFQLKSNLLDVPTEEIFGQPTARGELLGELLRMEKDLLFQIVEELKIELSPELETELKAVLTKDLRALLYLFQGIESSDLEDYIQAAEFYIKALKEDPDFILAAECLQELRELGLLPEGYIPPEPEKFGVRGDFPPDDRFKPDDRRPTPEPGPEPEPEPGPEPPNEYIPLDFLGKEGSWSGDGPDDTVYDYWTGYTYGLQTVGQNSKYGSAVLFTSQQRLDEINRNGFLAYSVQTDEDRLNEHIIGMANHANEIKLRVTALQTKGYSDIRARDAALSEMADAQSGRVLKDKAGNWVRVQQYVMRPDAQTVQLLNVCLRGEADLSTMDFTTKFGQSYTDDLRLLPWDQWLDAPRPYAGGIYIVNPLEAPLLDKMYVMFTNPENESLKEQRWFGDVRKSLASDVELWGQPISSEQLTLISLARGQETYGFNYYNGTPIEKGPFAVVTSAGTGNNPGGFKYVFLDGRDDINVGFFVVGDADRDDNQGVSAEYDDQSFNDIWDALRVNGRGGASNIGNNNLEIAIDSERNSFSRPIDVVYVPMSRMLWRNL